MAETINMALQKRKRITGSDDDQPPPKKVPATATSSEVYDPLCFVDIKPLLSSEQVITVLPPINVGVASTIRETPIGPVINMEDTSEIISIIHQPRTPSPIIILDSEDDTPVKDELPSPIHKPYQPVTSPISAPSSPKPILEIPDYSSYAINSPTRIRAMSQLFNGYSTLKQDLTISSDEEITYELDKSDTNSEATIDYSYLNEKEVSPNKPDIHQSGESTTCLIESSTPSPTTLDAEDTHRRSITFPTTEGTFEYDHHSDNEDYHNSNTFHGFSVVTYQTTVTQSNCYLQ